MSEIYIPSGVSELIDFIGWMILTMPEFKSTMTMNWTSETAFDVLNAGLLEICETAPETFCNDSMSLADLAKKELAEGDEEASYQALNTLYNNLTKLQTHGDTGHPVS